MSNKKQPASPVGPTWEGIYSEGRALNRYPFDSVVQFIYRSYSRAKPRVETKILEIGCGAGNNLWFAAREGFTVFGIDGSPSALEYAQKHFADEGLIGDLRLGDFVKLPYKDNTFDFVIDRAALTYVGFSDAHKTIAEVRRVLIPDGKFFFNPYSDHHSSYISGKPGPDGLTVDISCGTLVGTAPTMFYGKREILGMFGAGWKVTGLRHVEFMEELAPSYDCHAEWILTAEKV